jgi:flagellar M-ring protein FliF
MGSLLLRIRQWWDTADRSQRTVVLVGGSFLALLLIGTFMFASKPKMGLLYGNLSDAEQGSIVTEVQNMGIAVEMDGRGNVMIPTDRIPEVRSKLAMDGKTPKTAHMGNEDLSKMAMGTTPPVERERLKAILEGELAKSIEELEGVQNARVHLSLEQNSPFISEKQPAKGTVSIMEENGAFFTPNKGKAIALMVANAVPGLDIKNVMIVNQFSEPIYDPMNSEGASGVIAMKLETERAEAQRRRTQLQADLDRAFGPGATIAQVSNLEIDFDERQYDEVTNTPSETPVSSQEVKEEMGPGVGSPGANGEGTAGADSNTAAPQANDGAASDGQGYKSSQKVANYLQSVKNERVKKAAGTVTAMSVNVLVDKTKVEDPAPVESIVAGFLGNKTEDPNFTSTVTSVEFDTSATEINQKALAAQTSRNQMQQIMSMLPIGALLLVGFMVMRALGKVAKSQTPALATAGGPMLPVGAATTLADALTAVANTVGVPSVSHSTLALMESEANPEIRPIKDRLNIPLEQIKKMAEEKPEIVAMLVKSWLLEEGRR